MKARGHDPFCSPDSGFVCSAQSNLSGYGLHHTYDIGECCKELMLFGENDKEADIAYSTSEESVCGKYKLCLSWSRIFFVLYTSVSSKKHIFIYVLICV